MCINKNFDTLQFLLISAIKEKFYDGLLLGGFDSSIILALNPKVVALTVSLENYAEDVYYVNLFIKEFKFKYVHYKVDIEEALGAIPDVIKIIKSFDPAIPNDLAIYFGMKKAKEIGLTSVATGDGSDELFAGYSFMQKLDDLNSYISKIIKVMKFSSNTIAKFFGLKIIQPFTYKALVDFSLGLQANMKIHKAGGKIWGKWILRKAFQDILPDKVIWQSKRPIEVGSGMRHLREIITAKISDEEFKEKKLLYPVKFLNKEHLYYYEIYRKVVGNIPIPKQKEKICPGCGSGLKIDVFWCRVCGYVLNFL
ncbi:MAG: asparagine synthase C-terminal domain-containing protein [Candidatus Omnitrophica bacterium]|nr:asparagine synthase C-terminal domain-containing protein [Candidatus Omnitrophota bacterium]